MATMGKVARINWLINFLARCNEAYYNTGKTLVEDIEFDGLMEELKQLEKETGYVLANSPTQKVGCEVALGRTKLTHKHPMLSLDKTKSVEDFRNFIEDKGGVLMLKLDGLTIALTYEEGELVGAETRGNGIEGTDILHHAKVMKYVPLSLPTKESIVVIGEGLQTYKDFEITNSKLPEEDKLKHPRNVASGTLNGLDSQLTKDRGLQFFAYNIKGKKEVSKYDLMKELNNLGFMVCPHISILKETSLKEFQYNIDTLKITATQLDIPIDGMVLEYNDIKYGETLGRTAKFFNNAIAYKFEDATEETVLRNVVWQTSRTGLINPVAIFDTVILDNTEVSRASLHNISYIEGLDLHIGDTITVYKANQIIPQIQANLGGGDEKVTTTPICPACGSKVVVVDNMGTLTAMCMNSSCQAQITMKINHFASREAMNIDGLSEATINQFYSEGIIDSIPSLYKLLDGSKQLKITSLPKFGKKKYDKLINALQSSTRCSKPSNFLYGLGIPQVGKATSKDLVDYFRAISDSNLMAIKKIAKASKLQLMSINGIGEITAELIVDWFKNNRELFDELLTIITIEDEVQTISADNPLKGKKVYCTGKFALGKSELKEKITQLGGTYASGYSKSLDYLIAGGNISKSGKVKKALEDGVPVMTEEELMKLF